ncbi:MAG: riboflavin synthase [Propionibacteriaceae bacterium]|nr:riboflavin synthase [Propionibacteriaceae bacterium]
MFTGIVEELGEVRELTTGAESATLTVHGPTVVSDAGHGASISVNGVCLTVVTHDADSFTVDVMASTLERSSLGALRVGDRVNLERAMRADGRFGGHIVQGHVDAATKILSRTPGENWEVVRIALPESLARYVVDKGSIAVDGVSLTVSALGRADDDSVYFEVSLIPTTLDLTTLGHKQPGERVNLEVDVLAKYVERLVGPEVVR